MCTILVVTGGAAGTRLALAANRDELVDRASAPPGILVDVPRIAGGRDLVAGGTWLAVAADGRIAAVTNRHAEARDPSRRSRGELPLLALSAASGALARDWMGRLDAAAYNPCNLLVADAEGVAVAHVEAGAVRLVELSPGPHVVTTLDVDARGDAKVERLREGLDAALGGRPDGGELLRRLEALLGDHGADGHAERDAACIHGGEYGTVSSSSLLVASNGAIVYRHAAGRPCTTPRLDLSDLLSA